MYVQRLELVRLPAGADQSETGSAPVPRRLCTLLVFRYGPTSLRLVAWRTDAEWLRKIPKAFQSLYTLGSEESNIADDSLTELQGDSCLQTTNAVDLSCITFAVFGQYRMACDTVWRLIPHGVSGVSPILILSCHTSCVRSELVLIVIVAMSVVILLYDHDVHGLLNCLNQESYNSLVFLMFFDTPKSPGVWYLKFQGLKSCGKGDWAGTVLWNALLANIAPTKSSKVYYF